MLSNILSSVSDYIPETVSVVTESGQMIEAICYNLPMEKMMGTNPAYARSLYDLSKELGFPASYLKEIHDFI